MINLQKYEGLNLRPIRTNFAVSLDNLLSTLTPAMKGVVLNGVYQEMNYGLGLVVTVIRSKRGLWAIYIACPGDPTKNELLIGCGYTHGVLSGDRPTCQWKDNFRIKEATIELCTKFIGSDVDSYSELVMHLKTSETISKF